MQTTSYQLFIVLNFSINDIDINECADGANGSLTCSQVCVNDPGTFHCECYSGYTINSDMITCSG